MGFRITTIGTVIALFLLLVAGSVFAIALNTLEDISRIERTWERYNLDLKQKMHAFHGLRDAIGYDGAIHHFQTLLLRKDFRRIGTIHEKLAQAHRAIEMYRRSGVNEAETQALADIAAVLDRYEANLALVEQLIRDRVSSSAIHRSIRISDTPAIEGLAMLDRELRALRDVSAARLDDRVKHAQQDLGLFSLVLAGLLGVLVIAFFWFAHVRLAVPLTSLCRTMQLLVRGHLSAPVPYVGRQDEIGEMAGALLHLKESSLQRRRLESETALTNRRLEAEIADHERTAGELRIAIEQAKAASSAKSDFLATMSHEIRTPMNGVIGMAGLMLDTKLTGEQRSYAEAVRYSAEALLSIINDILDFSKLEAGKFELEASDFKVKDVVENVAELMGPQASGKRIDMLTFIAPDIPEVVNGDPGRLRQILLNLVGNAVKFTESGTVAIQAAVAINVTTEPGEDGRLRVRFSVDDTGIGVDEGLQSKLFEPFTQADTSTSRRFGGTGLGLAICRQLVELMEGEIGCESRDGGGSTFWFTVPLRTATQPISQEPPPSYDDLAGIRVLVVDDTALNREIFKKQFEAWGLYVATASNAEGAMTALSIAAESGRPFDLALIDYWMPHLDGEALGRRIRSVSALSRTKLVLATSSGMLEEEERARSAGFTAFLVKPVRQSVLFNCLADVCGRRQLQAAQQDEDIEPATAADPPVSGDQRLRILLAEDNQVNQLLATIMLQKEGHRVDVAHNGVEAVIAIRKFPYDMVLMDVNMPEMDGLEATAQIRALDAPLCQVPIIAMTANAMKGDRERYLDAGLDDYVSKPIDKNKLFAAIARHCPQSVSAGEIDERGEPESSPCAPSGEAVTALESIMGDIEEIADTVSHGTEQEPSQQPDSQGTNAMGSPRGVVRG